MSHDPFLDLRHELLAAHQRQRRRVRLPRLPSPGTLATAAIVIASLALCAGFIVVLRGGHDRERAVKKPKTFRSEIALLRRPQTAADRNAKVLGMLRIGPPGTEPKIDVSSMRLGASRPWGRVYYFLEQPPRPPKGPVRRVKGEVLGAVTTDGRGMPTGAAGGGPGPAQFAQFGGGSGAGGNPAVVSWLLPDGVARLRVFFPRQDYRWSQIYPRALTYDVPVRDNVVLLRIPRGAAGAATAWEEWYDASGHLIGRIVHFHPPAVPIPRPREDTASKRARQNLSAPNRVTVSPTVGGPRARFTVSFRRTITGNVGYGYHVSGPHRGGCRVYSIWPPDTLSGFGVRGTIDREPIGPASDAPETAWCRGTYRVTVAQGTTGKLAAPFGSATFTVR